MPEDSGFVPDYLMRSRGHMPQLRLLTVDQKDVPRSGCIRNSDVLIWEIWKCNKAVDDGRYALPEGHSAYSQQFVQKLGGMR